MQRREFLGGIAFLSLGAPAAGGAAAADSTAELSRIERRSGGRLGVAVLTADGLALTYRAEERFPMCSTFKTLAAGAVLARVDAVRESLERRIAYSKRDLLEYAPVTRQHAAQGFMTLGALCAAAMEYSDNTAANLILAALGGPQAVTRYVRTLGDTQTTLNRTEPSLNTVLPGDTRDTTTPAAMAADVHRLVLGTALSAQSRKTLASWLLASRTGDTLIKAGLPRSWRVGDKSGTGGKHNAYGDSSTRNDVAVAWPVRGAPVVVAAYLTDSKLPAAQRDASIAHVARTVATALRWV